MSGSGWKAAIATTNLRDQKDNVSFRPPAQLETIGFGGDGDQVDAFLALERHFNLEIDDTNAADWRTAGEVFSALLAAMPADQRHSEEIWSEFTAIMCEETGADASRVGCDTLLLAHPLSFIISQWARRVFLGRS